MRDGIGPKMFYYTLLIDTRCTWQEASWTLNPHNLRSCTRDLHLTNASQQKLLKCLQQHCTQSSCISILQKLLRVRRHCGLCKISPCGTFFLSHQTPCTNNVWKVWYYVRQSVPHKTSPCRTFSISCQTCPACPLYLENTASCVPNILDIATKLTPLWLPLSLPSSYIYVALLLTVSLFGYVIDSSADAHEWQCTWAKESTT